MEALFGDKKEKRERESEHAQREEEKRREERRKKKNIKLRTLNRLPHQLYLSSKKESFGVNFCKN